METKVIIREAKKVKEENKVEKGPQGPQGKIGIRGPQGYKGEQGEQGEQGPPGADGIDGYSGLDCSLISKYSLITTSSSFPDIVDINNIGQYLNRLLILEPTEDISLTFEHPPSDNNVYENYYILLNNSDFKVECIAKKDTDTLYFSFVLKPYKYRIIFFDNNRWNYHV